MRRGQDAIGTAGGTQALPQSVYEIEVREVAHVGIGVPASIGRDIENVGDISARPVRRHQVSPGFSFTRHGVVTVQLQRDCRTLRSADIAPALSAPCEREIRDLGWNASELSSID